MPYRGDAERKNRGKLYPLYALCFALPQKSAQAKTAQDIEAVFTTQSEQNLHADLLSVAFYPQKQACFTVECGNLFAIFRIYAVSS